MMNALLFKLATFIFLGGSAVAAFLYTKGPCANKAECPLGAKAAMASTMEQTAEPVAMKAHCSKQKAAMADAGKGTAAKSDCPYSSASVAIAQADEAATVETASNQ